MTLEEILNTDWSELKDLTEYTKFFQDAQVLKEQLTDFSLRWLRTKLISWKEIEEDGLIEDLNFFNYAARKIRGKGDNEFYTVIFPISLLLIDPSTLVYRGHCLFNSKTYPPSNETFDKFLSTAVSDIMKRFRINPEFEDLVKPVVLVSIEYVWYFDTDLRVRVLEELKKCSNVTVYNEIIYERFCHSDILFEVLPNNQVERLGLYTGFENLKKYNVWKRLYCGGLYYTGLFNNKFPEIEPTTLYYINKFGQPIEISQESLLFNLYNKIEVDIPNMTVDFCLHNHVYELRRNQLIYERVCYGYFRKIRVDLVEDRIIEEL